MRFCLCSWISQNKGDIDKIILMALICYYRQWRQTRIWVGKSIDRWHKYGESKRQRTVYVLPWHEIYFFHRNPLCWATDWGFAISSDIYTSLNYLQLIDLKINLKLIGLLPPTYNRSRFPKNAGVVCLKPATRTAMHVYHFQLSKFKIQSLTKTVSTWMSIGQVLLFFNNSIGFLVDK